MSIADLETVSETPHGPRSSDRPLAAVIDLASAATRRGGRSTCLSPVAMPSIAGHAGASHGCETMVGVSAPCRVPIAGLRDLGEHVHDMIRTPAGLRISATGPGGDPYEGDLLADIFEYRVLRAQALRGETLDAETMRRFETIEVRLRSRPDASLRGREARVYHRFDCVFDARVVADGVEISGEVENLSAGGIKIRMPGSLEPGAAVELVLGDGDDAVVLMSRVAWTRDGAAGLMFAGAPRCRD